MARAKKTFRGGLCLLLSLVMIVVGGAGGFILYLQGIQPDSQGLPASGDIEVHFLELGNAYTGDCTYIRAGDTDILIDAGSKTSSIETIDGYLREHVTDGKLEYVIVTHAHEDHIAGFATNETTDSLFDLWECETIIDFSMTNKKETDSLYSKYLRERDAEIAAGATHYTAAQCIAEGKNVFELGQGITLTILDTAYYTEISSDENNYSVCCLLSQGETHYLFTGDLEAEGEASLVARNDLPEVDLFKAGHHGSKTSSTTTLLDVIQPDVVCVCCCCGSNEYGAKPENRFPTQAFVDRVAPYTDRVYVTSLCTDWESRSFTSMNGNITVSGAHGSLVVTGSANDVKLKDTVWFKENRTMPEAWAA